MRLLFGSLRVLLLASWGFDPIMFMSPVFDLEGALVETAIQVGNSVAYITAKVGMGLLIFAIAREKSEENELMAGEFAEEFASQMTLAD